LQAPTPRPPRPQLHARAHPRAGAPPALRVRRAPRRPLCAMASPYISLHLPTSPHISPYIAGARWRLPADLGLWELLRSPRCQQVFLVGHSLGGALATLTAVLLGSADPTEAATAAAGGPAAATTAALGAAAPPAAAAPAADSSGDAEGGAACGAEGAAAQPPPEPPPQSEEAWHLVPPPSPMTPPPPPPPPLPTPVTAQPPSPPPPSGTSAAASIGGTRGARPRPLLVSFGCPTVGNAAFVALQRQGWG